MRRMVFAALALALVAATGAVAQSSGGLKQRTFDLTIIVDAYDAEIWVDNVRLSGNVAKVTPGVHGVRVRVEGSYDYFENVNVTADRTLVVRPRPRTFAVTVRVNVPNAVIVVDGQRLAGTVATVSAGTHTLEVSADGYEDYSTSVTVAAPMVVDVTLEPSGYLLTVNANIRTARVILNGISRGTVPFSEYLPAGEYTVKVSATGYADYVASVTLDGPITINAALSQGQQGGRGSAFMSFVLPSEFQDPENWERFRDRDRGGRDMDELIRIYVDGRLATQRRELEKIPVAPGRHRIRIASGAFSIELGEFDFAAGVSYVFELEMDVVVRTERRIRKN